MLKIKNGVANGIRTRANRATVCCANLYTIATVNRLFQMNNAMTIASLTTYVLYMLTVILTSKYSETLLLESYLLDGDN